jgi:DDE superfamily endonuclease
MKATFTYVHTFSSKIWLGIVLATQRTASPPVLSNLLSFIDGELEAIDTDDEDEVNDRREFNVKLSSARVEVEHTFGILKSRFPILSNLASIIGYIDTNERVFHCS